MGFEWIFNQHVKEDDSPGKLVEPDFRVTTGSHGFKTMRAGIFDNANFQNMVFI
jgi:hypothetical protein